MDGRLVMRLMDLEVNGIGKECLECWRVVDGSGPGRECGKLGL